MMNNNYVIVIEQTKKDIEFNSNQQMDSIHKLTIDNKQLEDQIIQF